MADNSGPTARNSAAGRSGSEPSDSLKKIQAEYSKLSDKVKQNALDYFLQGNVHRIQIYQNKQTVDITAKCWRSMRKNEPPHSVNLIISGEKLEDATCSCKAG